MALVFHDTAASTAAGERLSVSGSTSTSTGRAPTCSITFTEAVNVSGVVITSSPGPTPRVASAVCSPAVQELSASALGAPRCAANSASKRFVLGPVVIQSERSVSTTSRISSEEHTSELQSPVHLVCRLLLEKKKQHEEVETRSRKSETKTKK